jgi:hypothetical protein
MFQTVLIGHLLVNKIAAPLLSLPENGIGVKLRFMSVILGEFRDE